MGKERGVDGEAGQGHPVAATVEFPLVTKASQQACWDAIAQANEAVELAKSQLACLSVQAFFEEHPEVASASLDGEWCGDDEGGSDYWGRACVALAEGVEDEDGELAERLGEEFASIFEEWADGFEGACFEAADGFQRAGKLLLPDGGFEKWIAQAEAVEIDKAASPGASGRDAKLRI